MRILGDSKWVSVHEGYFQALKELNSSQSGGIDHPHGGHKNHPQMTGFFWWVDCIGFPAIPKSFLGIGTRKLWDPRVQDMEPQKTKLPRHLAMVKELSLGLFKEFAK